MARAKKKATRKKRAPAPATAEAPLPPPSQFLPQGQWAELFSLDKPILGSDLQRYREVTGSKVSNVSSALGIPRATKWYELINPSKRGTKPVPDIAMALLVRLYVAFPETRPSTDIDFLAFLNKLNVEPSEFAQLTGRAFYAGSLWERENPPNATVKLLAEALARAKVDTRDHPIFKALEAFSAHEHNARGEPLRIRRPKRRGFRSPRVVTQAERDLMTPVED